MRQARANKNSYLKYEKAYNQTPKGKAEHKLALKKYRSSEHGKRKSRDYHLRRRYGITLAEYEAMFEAQGRVCAICGSDGKIRGFNVDYRRQIGKVMGILCHQCNSGLGLFRKDPERVRSAMKYLIKHRA